MTTIIDSKFVDKSQRDDIFDASSGFAKICSKLYVWGFSKTLSRRFFVEL